MIIDSHQHFWEIARKDCSWPTPDLKAIYRDFAPDDYRRAVSGTEIAGSVLVQSQPQDSDTDYLLEIAASNAEVLAVVGWADLVDPSVATRIGKLAEHKKLRGLRPMLQAIEDENWILRAELQAGINAMQKHELRFDALIQPRHLPAMIEFARANPGLQVVVDHAAKPDIANDEFEAWSTGIATLAACENVYCKLSGLVTEAAHEQLGKQKVFAPYVAHLVSCFGCKRIMWGSDWPVVNLASDLQAWLAEARELLLVAGVNAAELPQVFHRTAHDFYKLGK